MKLKVRNFLIFRYGDEWGMEFMMNGAKQQYDEALTKAKKIIIIIYRLKYKIKKIRKHPKFKKNTMTKK